MQKCPCRGINKVLCYLICKYWDAQLYEKDENATKPVNHLWSCGISINCIYLVGKRNK